MNFDLDALEAATRKTFDLVVGHRDGKDDKSTQGDPVGFRLLGSSSEEYQRIDRAIQVLNVKESATRRKLVDMETDEGAQAVVDGGIKRRDMIIEACVVDWFGFTIGENKPAKFTPENLARALNARPRWRNQIVAAIEDEGNFTEG